MSEELPTLIEPKHLALKGCHLKGKVALTKMVRLRDSLCEGGKEHVHIDWLFAVDEQNRPKINGYMQTRLPLLCQRCLQTMLWSIDTKIAFMIITKDEKEDEIPAGYEALTLTSTRVSLITLIEDELILALPIVAIHEKCPSNEYQLPNSSAPDNTFQNNPFLILAKLKNNN
jgi:uncharacterized protein